MCVYVSGSNAIISITHAGLAGGRSSHCERLSQNELLSSLALTQSATGKCRRCWNWNWSWRRSRRRHTHVTFIEQCPTRSQRRGPHADNICADICALQSAVSCAQNVAILVSRFVIPPHSFPPFSAASLAFVIVIIAAWNGIQFFYLLLTVDGSREELGERFAYRVASVGSGCDINWALANN